jgi:tetratricopeptide (TPR) repeat protein
LNILLAVLLASASAAPAKKAAAIPEEARRAFVKGNTAFADAKDADGFRKAASRYEEAMKLAPKWPEPVFNLAKAREAAHDYSGALSAVNAYLKLGISEADKRQATDWSYALEEKAESKGKEAAQNSALDRFVGTWTRTLHNSHGDSLVQSIAVTREGAALRIEDASSVKPPYDVAVKDGKLEVKLPYTLRHPDRVQIVAVAQYTGSISADGRSLSFSAPVFLPYTPEQEAYWRSWGRPGDAWGGKPWEKQ